MTGDNKEADSAGDPDVAGVPGAEDPMLARLHDLIDRIEIRDVRTVKWVGEIVRHNNTEGTATMQAQPPRFRLAEDEINVWFEHRVEIADDDGAIATIEVGVIVDCDLAAGPPPDAELISCFADTNAFFIAYPYVRESVHTIARRLGLGGVVLGIVKRDTPLPDVLPRTPALRV